MTTYFIFEGKNQDIYNALSFMIEDKMIRNRIPDGRTKNAKLEKYRQVWTAYNNPERKAAAFKHFFGLSKKQIMKDNRLDLQLFAEKIDPTLEVYMMAAAKEQGLLNVDPAILIQKSLESIRKRAVAIETAEKILADLRKEFNLVPA